jgi:NAD(P)-dependent dehydrogenase (short-subunit alcohol dehydrogenase family)
MDVADPESVAAAAKRIAAEVGGLHAVVNNAGVIVQGPLELVPADELRRQFEVNTLGPASVVREFLPLLRAGSGGNPGRIVNISAPTGRIAVPLLTVLSASKAGVESFSNGLRMELAAWKIPVVVVEPGLTATAIFDKAGDAEKDAQSQADPDLLALYRGHLEAAEKTAANQKPDPVEKVAAAIVRAVGSARPKRRYVVGNARAMSMLNHLPARLRDRLVVTAFGLNKVEV